MRWGLNEGQGKKNVKQRNQQLRPLLSCWAQLQNKTLLALSPFLPFFSTMEGQDFRFQRIKESHQFIYLFSVLFLAHVSTYGGLCLRKIFTTKMVVLTDVEFGRAGTQTRVRSSTLSTQSGAIPHPSTKKVWLCLTSSFKASEPAGLVLWQILSAEFLKTFKIY